MRRPEWRHLQDHYGVNYTLKANRKTLNDVFEPGPVILSGLNYVLRRRGPMALSVNCRRIRRVKRWPVRTCRFISILSAIRVSHKDDALMRPDVFSGFIVGFNSCRPKSEGRSVSSARVPKTPRPSARVISRTRTRPKLSRWRD